MPFLLIRLRCLTKCRTIYNLFLSGDKEQKSDLVTHVSKLKRYFFEYPLPPDTLESLLELERNIMAARGTQKQQIENGIFECIHHGISSWDFEEAETVETDIPEQMADNKQTKTETQREQ